MFARHCAICAFVFLFCAVSIVRPKDNETFSMPSSVLLFGGSGEGLTLISPNQSETLRFPPNVPNRPVAIASIGPGGRLVSWGFPIKSDPGKRWKVQCAVGLYSISDKSWHTYGDFSEILATAISNDGSIVAFIAEETDSDSRQLFLLDVISGHITRLANTSATSVGWSPDRSKLVLGTPGGSVSSVIEIFDIASRSVHRLAEGISAAWAPSGDWITFFDHSNERLRLIHPDGADNHILRNVGGHIFGYRFFGGQPVWSPDGKELLLNEYKGEGETSDVVLLNIETGRMIRKSLNGLDVLGWRTLDK
jgi:hypothetical protein